MVSELPDNNEPLDNEKKEPEENYMGVGIAIGVGVGIALGSALGNVGVGLAVGLALGIAFGVGLRPKKPK